MQPLNPPAPTLLFDGVCNLCSGAVQFILAHERPNSPLRFTSLQSDAGQALLQHAGLRTDFLESLVLIDNGRAYTESSAALRTAAYLKAPWRWVRLFLIIPYFLRDPIYRWIARNRYRWFGQKTECWLPTPDLKARFL